MGFAPLKGVKSGNNTATASPMPSATSTTSSAMMLSWDITACVLMTGLVGVLLW
jgi:hypothetical protein